MDDTVPTPPRSPSIHREKVTVYVRVVFLKLGEIDTVHECFAADVFVQAKWRESTLDNTESTDHDKIDWGKLWNPKLYVDNSQGDIKETVWNSVAYNSKHHAYVYESRRIKGTFLENMELDRFPFDTQDLTLTLISQHCTDEVVLVEDTREPSSINTHTFVDAQEWRVYRAVETCQDVVDKVFEGGCGDYPRISFKCRASRRVGFYLWNIFVVLFLLSSLAFAPFAIPSITAQGRLSTTFTLLLSQVTFRYTVNNSIPRISYLTYLDKYVLFSMTMLSSLAIWHSVIANISLIAANYPAHSAVVLDKIFLAAVGSFYVCCQLLFWAYVYFRIIRPRNVYEKQETDETVKLHKKPRI